MPTEFGTNAVRLSGGRLANKNQQKNRCFANEIALSANGGKNRAKKPANGQGGRYPVNSFIFNDGGLFANYTYTISCYIIAVQEVVALKNQKYHLYLSDDEYRQTIDFKKFPIFQSKYWTHFAYILLKSVPLKPEATAIFARFPGLPSNLKFWLHKPSHSLSSFGDTILLCPLLNEHRIIASKYR